MGETRANRSSYEEATIFIFFWLLAAWAFRLLAPFFLNTWVGTLWVSEGVHKVICQGRQDMG